MDAITISTDMMIGLVLGVALPCLFWALRVYSMVKHTREMHIQTSEQQDDYHASIKSLRYAFKELSHFMRWMVKEQTGKEPPPYVRDD